MPGTCVWNDAVLERHLASIHSPTSDTSLSYVASCLQAADKQLSGLRWSREDVWSCSGAKSVHAQQLLGCQRYLSACSCLRMTVPGMTERFVPDCGDEVLDKPCASLLHAETNGLWASQATSTP